MKALTVEIKIVWFPKSGQQGNRIDGSAQQLICQRVEHNDPFVFDPRND